MSVQDTETSVVTSGSTTTDAMSQFFSIGTTNDPAYLIVNALDRNEYTSAGNGDTGDFSGNGATLDLSSIGQDGRGAGIVFTWQASSHSYVNATYGAFSSLDFTSSDCSNDVTNISLFTTTNLSLANACANNAYGLIQQDAAGYAGSVTFANDPNFSGTVPAQATPDGIAAAAMSFVGDAWNEEGCWVLASTIAAEAGAGLPVQSTSIGTPGKPNGEWVTVYNGPSGGSANWQSLVSTGDIVVFTPAGGGGHITTCVSGSGTTAMLVDNITYEGSNGKISNLANDGSSSDIIVSAPHLASQEWNGVSSGSVVIYALDTPVVTDIKSTASVTAHGTLSLSSLFSVKDTGGKPITQYQVYNSVSGDSILLNGKVQSGVSSSAPLSATSLTTLGLLAGGSAATDTLEIRAFNGTYWGDWQSLGAAPGVGIQDSGPELEAGAGSQFVAGNQPVQGPSRPGAYLLGRRRCRHIVAILAVFQRGQGQLFGHGSLGPREFLGDGDGDGHRGLVVIGNIRGERGGPGADDRGENAESIGGRGQQRKSLAPDRHLRRSARREPDLHGNPGRRRPPAELAAVQCQQPELFRHRADHDSRTASGGNRDRHKQPVRGRCLHPDHRKGGRRHHGNFGLARHGAGSATVRPRRGPVGTCNGRHA
jgi:hypothetical protein